MPVISNASRWVLKRGKHAGDLVQVVRTTDVSVFFTSLGGGNNQGNQKVDTSQVHTLSRVTFQARYVPESVAATAHTKAGTAYRRMYQPKPKPLETVPNPILEPSSLALSVSIETITPDKAQQWLNNGGINRKLNERGITRFMQAMQRGEWQLTGEGIKLDAEGKVRDGQNRLTAVVRSGCTIQSLVVRNVTERAFDVMDSGRARSPSDVLSIRGYVSTTALASIARNLINYEHFGTIDPHSVIERSYVTTPLILSYVTDHPEILQGMHLADNIRKAGLQGGTGLWGFLCTLWWRIDQEHCVSFATKLEKGIELEAGHPALLLRNKALNRGMKWAMDGTRREELAIMAMKAWNAYCQGSTLSQLRVREDERYPNLKAPQ